MDIELSEQISIPYEKFFARFSEIESLPLEEWKTVHVLAYLCSRYKEYYNLKYSFRFNNPAPSKSFEVFQIKKLSNMLSSDPKLLKSYLDWVFDTKVIERKKRITSLGYFVHPEIINEYKFKFLFNKPILRSDKLPDNIITYLKTANVDLETYGDLAFFSKIPGKEGVFEELEHLGFKNEILDHLK